MSPLPVRIRAELVAVRQYEAAATVALDSARRAFRAGLPCFPIVARRLDEHACLERAAHDASSRAWRLLALERGRRSGWAQGLSEAMDARLLTQVLGGPDARGGAKALPLPLTFPKSRLLSPSEGPQARRTPRPHSDLGTTEATGWGQRREPAPVRG